MKYLIHVQNIIACVVDDYDGDYGGDDKYDTDCWMLIMNVDYIWLASLNAMRIKISFAVAFDFNQLIYAVCSPPWPLPVPLCRFFTLSLPALWKSFPVRPSIPPKLYLTGDGLPK